MQWVVGQQKEKQFVLSKERKNTLSFTSEFGFQKCCQGTECLILSVCYQELHLSTGGCLHRWVIPKTTGVWVTSPHPLLLCLSQTWQSNWAPAWRSWWVFTQLHKLALLVPRGHKAVKAGSSFSSLHKISRTTGHHLLFYPLLASAALWCSTACCRDKTVL